MESIKRVQYGEARNAGCNVIWWETFSGKHYWLTYPLEWYNDTGDHPIDVLRLETEGRFLVTSYTSFELMEPMYEVPNRGKCEGRFELD